MKNDSHLLSPHLRVIATSLILCCGFLILLGALPSAGVSANENPPIPTPTPLPTLFPTSTPPMPNMPILVPAPVGETVIFTSPVELGVVDAFVQVITPGEQIDESFAGAILQPANEDDSCDDYLHHNAGTLYETLSGNGYAYFNGIAPGNYCMTAEIDEASLGGGSVANAWTSPAPAFVTIPEDADMLDLGQIEFIVPPKRIVGSVVDDSGVGIAGVSANAWNDSPGPFGGMWLNAETDASGNFVMNVGGGVWNVDIYVDNSIGFSDNTNRTVAFANNDSAEEQAIQFDIQRSNAQLTGRLLNADGSPHNGYETMGMLWIEAYSVDGDFHGYAEPSQDGTFTMPLRPATYNVAVYVEQWSFPNLFAPAPFEVTIGTDETVNIGDIMLGSPQVTAQIVGQDGTTPMSADYSVYATTDHNGDGIAACNEQGGTTTMPSPPMPYDYGMPGSDYFEYYGYVPDTGVMEIGGLPVGDYCLQINIHSDGSTYNPTIEEIFSIDDESALIDLGTLAPAASLKHLTGRVVRADGTGVEGIYINGSSYSGYHGGWVSTHTDADGNFSLDLAAGEWEIYIDLYSVYYPEFDDPALDPMFYDPFYGMSQMWFTNEAFKFVTFADDGVEETQTVEFTVSEANSTITGTLLKPDGTPAIGVNGEIHATSEQLDNSWINGYIDPETATYQLSVVGGDWQVGFNLYSYGYGDASDDYVESGPTVTVNVADGSTTQQDFTLQAYDATIKGTVLNADGSPLAYGHVWVNSVMNEDDPEAMEQYIYRYADVINGEFEVKVLSGIKYEVGVESYDMYGYEEAIQPDMQYVTPQPDSVTELVMQFGEPDAAIVGTVYIADTATVAANAEISAWSSNGQYRWTTADADGNFSLTVQSGSTWYLSAWWYDDSGYLPYHTTGEIEIEVAEAGQVNQDLAVVAEDYVIPPMVETIFDVNEPQSVSLGDGTVVEVPAGAVPVEDAEGEDVQLVITPLTADLPGSYTTDAVDYGYDIQIYNQHSGDEITVELNLDIVIVYQYEDDALAEMNADESTIEPVVRPTEDDEWDAADTFVVNPDTNEVRLSVSQPSEAAMTVRPSRPDASTDGSENNTPQDDTEFLFVPLMFQ